MYVRLCVMTIILAVLMLTHYGEATDDAESLTPESRIVNGEPVLKSIPFMTHINFVVTSCGGSLIGKRYVLTVAHCTERFNKTLGGEVILRSLRVEKPFSPFVIRVEISTVKSHEKFNASAPFDAHDIGMVILKREIGSDEVKPVMYASIRDNHQLLNKIQDVTLLGWGITDLTKNTSSSQFLMSTKLKILTMDECASAIVKSKSKTLADSMDFMIGNHNVLCMKGLRDKHSKSSSGAKGDSGGPILYEIPNEERKYYCNEWRQGSSSPCYLLFGVYDGSFGYQKPHNQQVKLIIDYAIRVSSFAQWIENVITSQNC